MAGVVAGVEISHRGVQVDFGGFGCVVDWEGLLVVVLVLCGGGDVVDIVVFIVVGGGAVVKIVVIQVLGGGTVVDAVVFCGCAVVDDGLADVGKDEVMAVVVGWVVGPLVILITGG